MSDHPIKPFLINKDEDGAFRLTVRDTRYNSQGYPIVTATMHEERFRTAAMAKTFARENFAAKVGEYAMK